MKENATRRLVIFIIALSILAMILGVITVRDTAEKYATEKIDELLQGQLPPPYLLDYGKISISLFNNELYIKKLHIFPDSLSKDSFDQKMYDVNLPFFDLKFESLWSILKNKELVITDVSLRNPNLSIRDFGKEKGTTLSQESADIIKVMSQYLDIFEIERLDIKNARFSFHHGDQQEKDGFIIKDIDFHLTDFMVDSTGSKRHFLNARTIDLVVHQETYFLPDSIHQFSFDQFRLSTRDSLISFDNIVIAPVDKNVGSNKAINRVNDIFDIVIPQLNINGIEFYDSYLSENFSIKEIALNDASIFYKQKQQTTSEAESQENPLNSILSNLAPTINIEKLAFYNAGVNLSLPFINRELLEVKVDSLLLYDCLMDPGNFQLSKEARNIDQFELYASNFKENLPEQNLNIAFDRAKLNSRNKTLYLSNLEIKPNYSNSAATQVSQKVAGIQILGLDYFEVWFDQVINLYRVNLKSPETIVELSQSQQDTLTNPDTLGIQSIHQLFNGLLYQQLNLAFLNISNGAFTIPGNLNIGRYDLNCRGLKLNKWIKNWKELTDSLNLTLNDIEHKNKDGKINIKAIQTDGSAYRFSNAKVDLNLPALRTKLRFKQLRVDSTDLDSLIAQKYQCNTLTLEGLRFDGHLNKISQTPEGSQKEIPIPFRAHHFELIDAQVQVETANKQKITAGRIDAILQLDSLTELHTLLLDNFKSNAPQQPFELHLDRLQKLEQEYSFKLSNIMLFPKDSNRENYLMLNIPDLFVKQWDKKRWANDQQLHFEALELTKPILTLEQVKKISQPKHRQVELPDLSIDSIRFFKGVFLGTWLGPDDSTVVRLPEYELCAAGVNTSNFNGDLFDMDQLYQAFQLHNNQPLEIDHPAFKAEVQNVNLELPGGNLALEMINFEEKNPSRDHNSSIQKIELKGWKKKDWFTDRSLTADSLMVGPAKTAISFPEQDGLSSDTSNFSFTEPIETGLSSLTLDYLRLEKTDLNLYNEDSFLLKGITLEANQLELDSTVLLPHLDDYYGKLNFGMDQFRTKIGRFKEYQISNSLNYLSDEQTLTFGNVRLAPQYSKEEYTQLLEFQADYFDATIPGICFHEVKPKDFFQPIIALRKITVSGFDASIYRSQHIPHPEQPIALVQDQIRQIPYPFELDTLVLTGDIHFSILPENVSEKATITFDRLDGTLACISNQAALRSTPMVLDAEGYMFEETPINARVNFSMNDSLNSFKMKGSVGQMNIPVMNNILTPTARIFIKSGMNRSIDFEVSANDDVAIGDMFFRYNKLKFRIVNKDDYTQTNLGNSILSFWANRLVKSNNPSFLRKRMGIIYYERNKNRAIFNYWSRALLSGVISSVGVKNNKKKLRKMGIEKLEAADYQEIFEDGFRVKDKLGKNRKRDKR